MPVSFHFYANKEINQSDYFRTVRLSNIRTKQFEKQLSHRITCRNCLLAPEEVNSVPIQVGGNRAVFFFLKCRQCGMEGSFQTSTDL